MALELTVNGRRLEVDAPDTASLAFVLRENLKLTGTKIGCFEGRCGACTVLVDGHAVASCLYPVGLVSGAEVRTVEGLAAPGEPLSRLQQSFLDHGAVQCGICAPGILMALTAFLDANPRPTEKDIREALAGNLCRCTGYRKIIDAALGAVKNGSRV